MLAVIDYGAGNLRSVLNALAALGQDPVVTNRPADVLAARALVLPGVGAAGDTVRSLNSLGLSEAILKVIAEGRPLLGICIGLQVLFGETEEGGWQPGLGVIPGSVRRLPPGLKVPHMGWNQVRQRFAHPVFDGIPDSTDFYFVHSFYASPEDKMLIAGETDYGVNFCSVIARGNLVATQFHPEKSGEAGLKMYSNFLKMAGLGTG